MKLSNADEWAPPDHWQKLTVIDSHAAGEPFRVVTGGLPAIPGNSVLEMRRHATLHLDHLRQALMWEPRGHADMYGGWLGPPMLPDSDLSVLFLHNAGFSTMCGHGIIALTKVVLDTGVILVDTGDPTLRIDTPAGQVTSTASMSGGLVDSVRFRNVASFVDSFDNVVHVDGIGDVRFDIAYGGAYYAFVDGPRLGIAWPPVTTAAVIDLGRRIKEAVVSATDIAHPTHADLGFLYGVIFTGPPANPRNHCRNVCVFADGEVDRSPTGTGVSAQVALETARGELGFGDRIVVESIVGSEFAGMLLEETFVGDRPAVIPGISGTARITGRSEFWFDPDDELSPGFLLR